MANLLEKGRGIATLISKMHRLSLCSEILSTTRFVPCIGQIRQMSRVKTRHTRPPFWHRQKEITFDPEKITSENEEFVTEAIAEKYSSPLAVEPWPHHEPVERSLRCGLVAKLIGRYPMWSKNGKRFDTTLLHVIDNHVIRYIPPEEVWRRDQQLNDRSRKYKSIGVAHLVIGAKSDDPRNFTKEYAQLFSEAGVMPKKMLFKFNISPDARLQPGTPLFATHFRPGDSIDIAGLTTDRGFQGVMKRWGFKGMPASHGVTKSHRKGGNTGGGGEKGRVWPGTKLPGHMGRKLVTGRGFKILRINTKHNVIWVNGFVHGEANNYVKVHDTILPLKKPPLEKRGPFPTYFPQDDETLAEDLYADVVHDFSLPSISFVAAK